MQDLHRQLRLVLVQVGHFPAVWLGPVLPTPRASVPTLVLIMFLKFSVSYDVLIFGGT